MFLEIPAKGLGCHVGLFGYIFQRDGFVILLHDEVINGSDADAFVFAIGGGLSARRQGLQFIEGTELFQKLDKVDQLVNACGGLHTKHFCRYFGGVLRGDLEAGLLILEEIFQVLDLGQFEEAIELSFDVEKDIQGLDFFPAGRGEIGRITFKNMGQVHSEPVDLSRAECVHIIFGNQGSLSLLDPGQLDLLMTVQMRIKVRELIFLHDDSLVMWHRNGELQYFHLCIVLA